MYNHITQSERVSSTNNWTPFILKKQGSANHATKNYSTSLHIAEPVPVPYTNSGD